MRLRWINLVFVCALSVVFVGLALGGEGRIPYSAYHGLPLRKEYIREYEPIKVEYPVKTESTRIDVAHREAVVRREEEFPGYMGMFGGLFAAMTFIVFDLLLASFGVAGYYVNHDHTFWLLSSGAIVGFLYSYSDYVRKKAILEDLRDKS